MERQTGFHNGRPQFWRKASPGVKVMIVVGGILLVGALVASVGVVLMLLWNWLVVRLFKLPTIDLVEAWGLLLLSAILFRGFPSGRTFSEARQARYRRMLRDRALSLEDEENK